MSGVEPFPEPPPRAYSYPWYELVEKGAATPMEVCLIPTEPGTLAIEQFRWKILKKLGEEDWEVSYEIPDKEAWKRIRIENPHVVEDARRMGRSVPIPHVLSESRWRVWCLGPRPVEPGWVRDKNSPLAKMWRIERR
jgi:hypothetical protein